MSTNYYEIKVGENGYKYVTLESVEAIFHMSIGNSKVGPCACYNLPIEYTCKHCIECYKKGKCYACGGFYQAGNNQKLYSENYKFFLENEESVIVAAIVEWVKKSGLRFCRYFTCGDIPNTKFFRIMIKVAIALPEIKFWSYTKKYSIVNRYISANGKRAIPKNLKIIFSHWLNEDGTYYPMENPYKMPTSEFIPYGKEELVNSVTFVCPCSDPTVQVTCTTCEHGCYNLKEGQSMALLEHSTKETRKRDQEIKAAKKALKKF